MVQSGPLYQGKDTYGRCRDHSNVENYESAELTSSIAGRSKSPPLVPSERVQHPDRTADHVCSGGRERDTACPRFRQNAADQVKEEEIAYERDNEVRDSNHNELREVRGVFGRPPGPYTSLIRVMSVRHRHVPSNRHRFAFHLQVNTRYPAYNQHYAAHSSYRRLPSPTVRSSRTGRPCDL